MSSNKQGINSNKIQDIDNNDLRDINNTVQEISMGIRGNNRGWLKGEGMCEWCGLRRAEVNLELKYGTHRECRSCWGD